MNNVVKFLKGKKTYIIGAIVCILGFLKATDIFVVPEYVYIVLGGMGLVAVRLGVNKVADVIKEILPEPKKITSAKKK